MRELVVGVVVEELAEAEVADLRDHVGDRHIAAAGCLARWPGRGHEQHVRRLDVAVDNAVGMGVRDGGGQCPHEFRGLPRDHRTGVVLQPFGKVAPRAVFARDEDEACLLAHLVDRDDVRVNQPRGQFCFADEPPPKRHRDQSLGPGNLERDPPAENLVAGLEHICKRTAAGLADDLVPADPLRHDDRLIAGIPFRGGHLPQQQHRVDGGVEGRALVRFIGRRSIASEGNGIGRP